MSLQFRGTEPSPAPSPAVHHPSRKLNRLAARLLKPALLERSDASEELVNGLLAALLKLIGAPALLRGDPLVHAEAARAESLRHVALLGKRPVAVIAVVGCEREVRDAMEPLLMNLLAVLAQLPAPRVAQRLGHHVLDGEVPALEATDDVDALLAVLVLEPVVLEKIEQVGIGNGCLERTEPREAAGNGVIAIRADAIEASSLDIVAQRIRVRRGGARMLSSYARAPRTPVFSN